MRMGLDLGALDCPPVACHGPPLQAHDAVEAIMARVSQIAYFQAEHASLENVTSQDPSPFTTSSQESEPSPSSNASLASSFTWGAIGEGLQNAVAEPSGSSNLGPPSPPRSPPSTPAAATTSEEAAGTPVALSIMQTPMSSHHQQLCGDDYAAGMSGRTAVPTPSSAGSRGPAGGSRSSVQPKSGAHSRMLPGSQPRSASRGVRASQRIEFVNGSPLNNSQGMRSSFPAAAAASTPPRMTSLGSPAISMEASPAPGVSEYLAGPRRQLRTPPNKDSGDKAKASGQQEGVGHEAVGMRGVGGLVFAPGFFPVHGMGGHQASAMSRSAQFAYASMDRSLRSNMSVRDRGGVDFRPKWRI